MIDGDITDSEDELKEEELNMPKVIILEITLCLEHKLSINMMLVMVFRNPIF